MYIMLWTHVRWCFLLCVQVIWLSTKLTDSACVVVGMFERAWLKLTKSDK